VPENDATPGFPAWRSRFGEPRDAPIATELLEHDVVSVARALLGARIVSTVDARTVRAVIVETEAYLGPEDPASHAATAVGRTARNALMFGPAGFLYVYLIYGMHWCMNVVTGRDGRAQAVLLRGAEVLDGLDTVRERRGRTGARATTPARAAELLAGPGRLCQGLGVDGELNGHRLAQPPLTLRHGWTVPDAAVRVTGRVGIREAVDWPLRFVVDGSRGVSRGRAAPADPAAGPRGDGVVDSPP
jgi:DNA-3-methyladenine glycosylase